MTSSQCVYWNLWARLGISFPVMVLIFLLPHQASAQGMGTVTINQDPDYFAQTSAVQRCLWREGHSDLASTLSCPSPTINACYCPTPSPRKEEASADLTACMTTWYSVESTDIDSALSLYSRYCGTALGKAAIPLEILSLEPPR
jgi:hypothetical protein